MTRLPLDENDCRAIQEALNDDKRGAKWLAERTDIDVSVLRKMAKGEVRTSTRREILRKVLGVVDEKAPLSDEERKLITSYRRALLKAPADARAIIANTESDLESVYAAQVSLEEAQRRMDAVRTRAASPLVHRSASSKAPRKTPRAV